MAKKKDPFKDIIGSKKAKSKGEIKPGKASGKPRATPQNQKAQDEDHVGVAEHSGHKGSSRVKGFGMKKKRAIK